jgi:DNA-binding IclR family transcriptional regulator
VAGNSTDAGRSVTSKVTAILMVFADDGIHTLTEIAGSAHLPTSTAHRLASELVAWRLLERTEERHYRIGLPLRIVASEYSESEVRSYTQTVMRALPMLDDLSRATRSEVRLGVLRGSQVLTLQPRTNRFSERVHAARLRHGLIPAHAAAAGKVLLAFSPPGVIDHVIAAGLPAFTPHTITSPDVLRRKLSVIRLTQIATSRNEFECGKHRDADLLRGRPRRRRHRTRRPRSEHRMEAGRRRAIRCMPQSLAPTGHRVSRDGKVIDVGDGGGELRDTLVLHYDVEQAALDVLRKAM